MGGNLICQDKNIDIFYIYYKNFLYWLFKLMRKVVVMLFLSEPLRLIGDYPKIIIFPKIKGNFSANMYGSRYNQIKPAAYFKSATLNSYNQSLLKKIS